ALCSALRLCKKLRTVLFNAAQMSCSTFFTAWVLSLCFGPIVALPRHASTAHYLMAISVMIFGQFLANSALITVASSNQSGENIWRTWTKYYLWTSVTFIVGAPMAGFTAKLVSLVGFVVIPFTIPIILLLHLTYRTYLKNVEVAAAQAEQAEQ